MFRVCGYYNGNRVTVGTFATIESALVCWAKTGGTWIEDNGKRVPVIKVDSSRYRCGVTGVVSKIPTE